MTPEANDEISEQIKQADGRILGLEAIITSILGANPNIKIDEAAVGKLILDWKLDGDQMGAHEDIRTTARRTMHEITSRITESRIKLARGEK